MCKKQINYFVLNSYVLSPETVDASYFTVIYVPTPHRCFSGFSDVSRTEKHVAFFAHIHAQQPASLLEQNLRKFLVHFSSLVSMFQC